MTIRSSAGGSCCRLEPQLGDRSRSKSFFNVNYTNLKMIGLTRIHKYDHAQTFSFTDL